MIPKFQKAQLLAVELIDDSTGQVNQVTRLYQTDAFSIDGPRFPGGEEFLIRGQQGIKRGNVEADNGCQ